MWGPPGEGTARGFLGSGTAGLGDRQGFLGSGTAMLGDRQWNFGSGTAMLGDRQCNLGSGAADFVGPKNVVVRATYAGIVTYTSTKAFFTSFHGYFHGSCFTSMEAYLLPRKVFDFQVIQLYFTSI